MEPKIAESPSSDLTRVRQWRPAAQRNLRNQWSKLAALLQDWRAASNGGRSLATSIVNSYLTQKNMDSMDFGVLKDMPDIQKKACKKLFKQQEIFKDKLLSSYRNMVAVVISMSNTSKSMRCYTKGASNSPIAQFSFSIEDETDSGDCGGIPVFAHRSIAYFEQLAGEIVHMFVAELNVKRLLATKFLSLYADKIAEVAELQWSDEFYDGEFDDLRIIKLYSEETRQLLLPCLEIHDSNSSNRKQQENDALQVDITTWMVDSRIDNYRVDEIFDIVGAEMHVNFPGR